jgi:hypothetical protein
MMLPQKDLKAKDLDRNLIPHREVVKAYDDAGDDSQVYERTCHDRAYEWFYSQVTGKDSIKNQEIEQRISNLMRVRDKGGEWLVYGVGLFGKNWKGNRVDFYHTEGKIEGMPIFTKEIDPQTDQVVPGSTQVFEMKTIHNIPFSKKKIEELSQYFVAPSFIVVSNTMGGRKYSCSLEEFRDLPYDELISLKTGFTEYMRNKRPDQLKVGGVR